ncbi:hypothetical protein H9Q69_013608 [Fusarium xylarioides]|nr:hypothetical protein H9Q69_013608 [Fusarium xylarioides]
MHSSNTLSLLLAAFSGYASALPHYPSLPVPGVPGDHHPPGPRGPPNPPPPPSPSAPAPGLPHVSPPGVPTAQVCNGTYQGKHDTTLEMSSLLVFGFMEAATLMAHNNLFRAAVLESGSPVALFNEASDWQEYYDALVKKTGCDSASDNLECLRGLPWETLNNIFNNTTPLDVTAPTLTAVIDGDFMTAQASKLLLAGKFAHVPLLIGNNFDEGTAYAKKGINTTEQF